MFNIVSKTYEGPFEVLLMLVKDDELDVNRISVLDIVKSFSTKNINEGSDFIAGAANLIYMKSEALLPKEEEVLTEEDIDLQKLLEQYRRFKAVAGTLEKREEKQRDIFFKDVDHTGEFAEEQVVEVTLYDLLSCFKSVLAYLPKDEIMSISREGITVVQKTNELLEELEIDASAHVSRFINLEIAEAADKIYALAKNHIEILKLNFPSVKEKVELLGSKSVPDPIGLTLEEYRDSLDMIVAAVDKHILSKL